MFLVQIACYHYCIVICIVDVHGTAKRWSPYKAMFSPTALCVLLQYIMVAFRKKEYSNNHRQRFPTVLGASYLSREIFSKLRIFEFALCTAARRQRRYQFKDDQILFSPPLRRRSILGGSYELDPGQGEPSLPSLRGRYIGAW